MWVYYGTADGDLGIVGLASIIGVTPSDPPDGHAVIKLAWNKPVTLRLLANPFPALAVRKHIPRPQGPAWRIGPALSQALLNHSKKGTSSSAAAKPTVAYGAGFSSNIPYTPPKAFTVHRRHDALLRPMMNRLESSGWRAVKFDVGSKKVDLAMGRGGKIILVEAKTFNESSSQAVRGAYAQLAEYAWKYCEINQASAKSILRWALFESPPTVDEIRFLEAHDVLVSWALKAKRRLIHGPGTNSKAIAVGLR